MNYNILLDAKMCCIWSVSSGPSFSSRALPYNLFPSSLTSIAVKSEAWFTLVFELETIPSLEIGLEIVVMMMTS